MEHHVCHDSLSVLKSLLNLYVQNLASNTHQWLPKHMKTQSLSQLMKLLNAHAATPPPHLLLEVWLAGDNKLNTTHRWVLLVQFLLLWEEVQTVPERDLAHEASLGDGQRQVAEHVEGVGVVGADGAVQRAAQLPWEEVCTRGRGNRRELSEVFHPRASTDKLTARRTFSSPTILLSSRSRWFFHMAAASSESLGGVEWGGDKYVVDVRTEPSAKFGLLKENMSLHLMLPYNLPLQLNATQWYFTVDHKIVILLHTLSLLFNCIEINHQSLVPMTQLKGFHAWNLFQTTKKHTTL